MSSTPARLGLLPGGIDDEDPPVALLPRRIALILVPLLTLGAILAWVEADVHLLGWLRILAAALAGLALAALVLAMPVAPRRRARSRVVALATVLALALTAALFVPALLAHRAHGLGDVAILRTTALGTGDRVISAPGTGPASPVLVRRAAGKTDVLEARDGSVHTIATEKGAVVALSADASSALVTADGRTAVWSLDGAPRRVASVAGEPVAMVRQLLVVRACVGQSCEQRGYDLSASTTTPAWTKPDASGGRGPDAPGQDLTAESAPARLLETVEETGVVPSTVLRYAPDAGWTSVDAATGAVRGRSLAGPKDPCRVVVDPLPDAGGVVTDTESHPDALVVCRGGDGALTATASSSGSTVWSSEASPAGNWTVRVEGGAVLARGAAADGTTTEILASGARRSWAAPAGDAASDSGSASTGYRARVGIDGERAVMVDDHHRLVALDAADARTIWTLPLSAGRYPARGALGEGTVVVLDPAPRTHPLDPREATRLQVLDARTGDVTARAVMDRYPRTVVPVSGQRAIVDQADGAVLVGERGTTGS